MTSSASGLLGLVMIARDEERCIGRALDSCRDFVDELVVVDTGSRDNTVAVAEAAGARVSEFVWCDDFSAAKNVALSRSSCRWRLVLDADEWVSEGGEALREWCEGHHDVMGAVSVRSSFESEGQVFVSVDRNVRVLPAGARFTGRVHERPHHLSAIERTLLVVEHDGYLPTQAARKQGRNEVLLRESIGESDAPVLRFHLGQELEVQGRYGEAVDEYAIALSRMSGRESWRHPLLSRAIHCYGSSRRFREGLTLYQHAALEWPLSPDVHFSGGVLMLNFAVDRPDLAQSLLPLAREAWQTCLAIGERPDLEGAVSGRGSYLAEHNLAVIDTWPMATFRD